MEDPTGPPPAGGRTVGGNWFIALGAVFALGPLLAWLLLQGSGRLAVPAPGDPAATDPRAAILDSGAPSPP